MTDRLGAGPRTKHIDTRSFGVEQSSVCPTKTLNVWINTWPHEWFQRFHVPLIESGTQAFGECADSSVDLRKVTEHSCSTVPLFHIVQRYTSLHLALAKSGSRHRSCVFRLTRCSTLLVNQFVHHPDHRDRSAHVPHADVGDQSGSLARMALSTERGSSSNW